MSEPQTYQTMAGPPPPEGGVRRVAPGEPIRMRPDEFLLDLLERIEQMPGARSIAFTTADHERIGDVFVADRKVGLVALTQEEIPLSQRLHQRDPDTATRVRSAVALARAEGRPLGDVLAGLGADQSECIRLAILDQVVDGLAAIARMAPLGLFEVSVPAVMRNRRPILSAFAPTEVYWRAVAAVGVIREDAAERCFRAMSSLAEAAVLVARADSATGRDVPCAGIGLDSLGVHGIADLGRFAAEMARAPQLAAGGVVPRLILFGANQSALLCVAARFQVALLGGIGPEVRARVVSEALRFAGASDA